MWLRGTFVPPLPAALPAPQQSRHSPNGKCPGMGQCSAPRHLSRAVRSHRHPRVLSYRTEKKPVGGPWLFLQISCHPCSGNSECPMGGSGLWFPGAGCWGDPECHVSSEVQWENTAFWLIELQCSAMQQQLVHELGMGAFFAVLLGKGRCGCGSRPNHSNVLSTLSCS